MKKAKKGFLMALALSAVFVFANAGALLAETNTLPENLLFMSWDGAGSKNVFRMLEEGKLPNLKRVIDSGGKIIPLAVTGRTVTIPSWTEIFTGLSPDQSGAYGNKKYTGEITEAQIRSSRFGYWTRQVPYSATLPYLLKTGKEMEIGWIVSKKYLGADSNWSPISSIAKNNRRNYTIAVPSKGANDYLAKFRTKIDLFLSERSSDKKKFFLHVHTDPDEPGHLDGENSDRYRQEIVNSDILLGYILDRLPPNTAVVVTADHGFDADKKTHNNAPDSWIATNFPLGVLFGIIKDIPVTILDLFGMEIPPLMRGHSLLRPMEFPSR